MHKRSILFLTAIGILCTFFSCKQETIFYQIEQETELEEAVITGIVTSVVEFNGKLYACDGRIYSKGVNDIRGWQSFSKPDGYIEKLATGANVLFAMNSSKEVFSFDGKDWTRVELPDFDKDETVTIFCDGAGNAYIRIANSYRDLAPNQAMNPSSIEITSPVILKANGILFTAKDGAVSDALGGTVSDLGKVWALTYSATEKAVYAGTNSGLKKLPLDESGKLSGKTESVPGSNAESTLKDYEVFAVLATGDSLDNAALYASTVESGSSNTNVFGLWGYYYNRRNSWNVE